MKEQLTGNIKISVRNLVEFILRSGDIVSVRTGVRDAKAMQEGSKIHRKIQRSMGGDYHAEVFLKICVPIIVKENNYNICIEGRADGIFTEDGKKVIDEIKGVYMNLRNLKEPVPIHRFQVMCYAYIYAKEKQLEEIQIRLTYCKIETEEIQYFQEILSFDDLETWFLNLVGEYGKWVNWQHSWSQVRNESIKQLVFPFLYRIGQKDLITGVYQTIIRKRKLYIEAPTGVGKTISTIFPTVKAMGEGVVSKIFYMTAKTIARTVAEETYQMLIKAGLNMKIVTITAKEKLCVLEKTDCNPIACARAKGHYDRVNDGVFDLLTSNHEINRELIIEYAAKYQVCPFEMCLDLTNWADSIVCDYNYVFDPNVYLRRFFAEEKQNDYVFLIDEAHNLVERGREMYSAVLYKENFLLAKSYVKGRSKKMEIKLQSCNMDLLSLKRECDEFETLDQIEDFVLHLMRLVAEFEEFLLEFQNFDGREEVLLLYFDVRHFLNIYENVNEKYMIYTDYNEKDEFRIKLQCMDPSDNLARCLERGMSSIFFSATLLPIKYYKEQLAGKEEDYAVYAPSPFHPEKRLLMVGRDVSTQYKRRNEREYNKIIEYIALFGKERVGNYMIFFPSYEFMNQIAGKLMETKYKPIFQNMEIVVQKNNMTERDKEEFIEDFRTSPDKTRMGFCVMGGIFGEGIDLKEDRLIGVVIVGTGLPMICNEREMFRHYYDKKNGQGFDYAYLYHGMNKVLQSAGRVIRTMEDKGAILLLDERFQKNQYQQLFPREWFPHLLVNQSNAAKILKDFWLEK